MKTTVAIATAAPEAFSRSWSRTVAGVAGGVLVMSLGAHVRVPLPFTPVPMTLQLLAVLLIGLAMPTPRAVAAMAAYLAMGAVGFGVFAPGSLGFAGTTAGYLGGFLPACWLIAVLRGQSSPSYLRLVLAGSAGTAVVLVCGLLWLAKIMPGGLSGALAAGVLPFLPKATIEVLLAATAMIAWRGWRLRQRS